MKRFEQFFVTSLLCAALSWAGGLHAAEYSLEQEVGSLDGLDAKAARALLVRYSEGGILTYAPKQARVELLQAVIAASPEGGPTRSRAELLLKSARNGHWK